MRHAVALVLLAGLGFAQAQEGTWVGKTVITKEFGVKLTRKNKDDKEEYTPLTDSIYYRVGADNGPQVRIVTSTGQDGWIEKKHLVLTSQAIEHFTRELEVNQGSAEAYQKRAFARQYQGAPADAIKDANEAIRLAYYDMAAWNTRGVLYMTQRKYDLALRDLGLAIRFHPNHSAAYCNRGFVYTQLKKYEKATKDLNAAILLDPLQGHSYANRGLNHFMMQQYVEAKADFKLAQKLDPFNGHVYVYEAWMLATSVDADHRDGKKALELAKKALELEDRPLPFFQEALAAAHAEVGDFTEAIAAQERALSMMNAKAIDASAQGRLDLYRDKKAYRQE